MHFEIPTTYLQPGREEWLEEKLGEATIKSILSSLTGRDGFALPLSGEGFSDFGLTAEGVSPIALLCRVMLRSGMLLAQMNEYPNPELPPLEDVEISPEARVYLDFEEINVCRVTLSFTLFCPRV